MTDWTASNQDYAPAKRNAPPLHLAAHTGDHDAIRRLLADGADINEIAQLAMTDGASPASATPLMIAAGSEDGATVETVRLLLQLGANPSVTIDGVSAAHFAYRGVGWSVPPPGDAQRLAVLLDAGAPLDLACDLGNRTFCAACERDDVDALRTFLARGADPDGYWSAEEQRRSDEETNEHFRTLRENDEIDREFREMMGDEYEDISASLEREFLESSCSAPHSFQIPLFCAAEAGSLECVRTLLDAGADPGKRDNQSKAAIFYASSEPVIRELLRAGLSLEDRDEYSGTPLDNAVGDGPNAIPRIKALIAAGANVNATHDRGYTIFMSAAGSMERDRRILEILLEAGADPHAVTELGYNAFHAAVDVNGEANEEESVRSILGYLKELGVDIDRRNNFGHTPIARAIEEGTAIEVRVLAELGADVNVVCPRHVCGEERCEAISAPIVFAAISSAVDPDVKLAALLKAGVDLDVTDENGLSPLEHARSRLDALLTDRPDTKYTDEWIDEAKLCVRMLETAAARGA